MAKHLSLGWSGPRRRVAGALVAAALATAGCSGGFGPLEEEGFPLWLLQSLSGTVREAESPNAPIAGADVTFELVFEGILLTLGTAKTSSTGGYSFVAAHNTGVPGDFYRVIAPDDRERRLALRVRAMASGYLPTTRPLELVRSPSPEQPTRNLSAYNISGFVVALAKPKEVP